MKDWEHIPQGCFGYRNVITDNKTQEQHKVWLNF